MHQKKSKKQLKKWSFFRQKIDQIFTTKLWKKWSKKLTIFEPIRGRMGVRFSIFSESIDPLILPPHSIFTGVHSGHFFEKLLKISGPANLRGKCSKKWQKKAFLHVKNSKNPGPHPQKSGHFFRKKSLFYIEFSKARTNFVHGLFLDPLLMGKFGFTQKKLVWEV